MRAWATRYTRPPQICRHIALGIRCFGLDRFNAKYEVTREVGREGNRGFLDKNVLSKGSGCHFDQI